MKEGTPIGLTMGTEEAQVRSFTRPDTSTPQSILDVILTTKMPHRARPAPSLLWAWSNEHTRVLGFCLPVPFFLMFWSHRRQGQRSPPVRVWLPQGQGWGACLGSLVGPEEAGQTGSWCNLHCYSSQGMSEILQMGLDNKRDFLFGYTVCPNSSGLSGNRSPRPLSLALQNHKDDLLAHWDNSRAKIMTAGMCFPVEAVFPERRRWESRKHGAGRSPAFATCGVRVTGGAQEIHLLRFLFSGSFWRGVFSK